MVIVAQLHDPVVLAKSLATVDQLCCGRLTVGLGVGGRVEDYVAAGVDPKTRTHRDLARRVDMMDMQDTERRFEQVRVAWREAGRPAPRLTTAFWFALGGGARAQIVG